MRKAALLAALLLALGGVAAGCGGDSDDSAAPPPATETTPDDGDDGGSDVDGAAVYESAGCGGCHVLAAAGSAGTIGPNLDDVQPDADSVADQVRNGGGAMPAFSDTLSEDEILAVAEYVAANAGG